MVNKPVPPRPTPGESNGADLNYEKATVAELLRREFPENDWIIDDFIHSGDQVVLAGPPKIGKSILGTQLALTVAQGTGHFLSEAYKPKPKPRKVLVFSLEMNAPMVAERLGKVFPKKGADGADTIVSDDIPLLFVFSAEGRSSLDVVDFDPSEETKAKKAGSAFLSEDGDLLQDIVRYEKPDLVIFDTLIRVHALDENNNVAMSHLLRHLREICSIDELLPVKGSKDQSATEWHRKKIAHVLIHHTRKDSAVANSSANRDANAVRGAGAIHAEADLVLTLSEWDRSGTVMMSMSARRVSLPDEIFLRRNGLRFGKVDRPLGTRQTKAAQLAKALWTTFQERLPTDGALTRKQIVERVAQLGYGDLTEDNFRKTYYRKIAPYLLLDEPKKGDADQNHRYRLKADASEPRFYTALKAAQKTH